MSINESDIVMANLRVLTIKPKKIMIALTAIYYVLPNVLNKYLTESIIKF